MLLVACHIEDNRFHVHPDQFLQHNRPDKVCRAASRVAAVVGAYEMVLPLLKVVGGTIPHFRSAVGAIDHAGKQAALARFRSAVTLLTDLLHLVKDFLLDDCRVGVVENRLFLNGRFPLLLVPDRVGVGLEVDRTACVLPPFQNMNNRVGVPMVGVGSFGAWGFDALPAFVGSGVKHLFRLEQLCNLHRTSALHAQLEDTLDYKGGGFVHNPLRSVLRVFAVAKRHICCQRYATLALCFLHSPDFAACVFGEKLVKPVFDTRHIVVGAVGVDGVKVVVDGNIADAVFWKSEVDIQPGQRGITPKSGKVFRQHYYYFSRFDFRQHLLKAGAVIVGAAVPVIHEKGRVGKAVFFGVAEQDVFLIGDGIAIALVGVLLRKSAV